MLHREFPKGASEWLDAVSRRGFLKLMGASLAMAGMTACTKQPLEPIVPYVKQPEEVVPGRPLFYATAFTLGGYASPVLVESQLYRPTKIEGNDQHPASLGGTDIFAQASILGMYDPDRSQTVTYLGDVRSWGSLFEAMRAPLSIQKSLQGAGIRILTPTVSSPTLADQIAVISQALSAGQVACVRTGQPRQCARRREAGLWPAGGDAIRAGKCGRNSLARRRFSLRGIPRLHPLRPRFCQAPQSRCGEMNRLYVVESTPSSTGARADHRLPVRAVEIEAFCVVDLILLYEPARAVVPRPEQARNSCPRL